MRNLKFSLPHLQVREITIDNQFEITQPSIIINFSSEPIYLLIDNSSIKLLEARILYNQTLISKGAHVGLININENNFLNVSSFLEKELKRNWTHAGKLYPNIKELSKLDMFKSPKDVINGYELNFWFLKEKTNGRIHQKHTFTEIHLQVAGIGMMQKYASEKRSTLYETAYMIPGRIHYPFYDQNQQYPWHSYDAITNCIWMAIEKHTDI